MFIQTQAHRLNLSAAALCATAGLLGWVGNASAAITVTFAASGGNVVATIATSFNPPA